MSRLPQTRYGGTHARRHHGHSHDQGGDHVCPRGYLARHAPATWSGSDESRCGF